MTQLEEVVLTLGPKRPGISLASTFTDHIWNNYCNPEDKEELQVSHLHVIVDGDGWPYGDVVDFRSRLEAIHEAGKFGELSLRVSQVQDDDRHMDWQMRRCLRAIESGQEYVTRTDGSLLLTGDILDLIKVLDQRRLKAEQKMLAMLEPKLTREEAIERLKDADFFNTEDDMNGPGPRVPFIDSKRDNPDYKWVALDGGYTAKELEAFLFFLREAETK